MSKICKVNATTVAKEPTLNPTEIVLTENERIVEKRYATGLQPFGHVSENQEVKQHVSTEFKALFQSFYNADDRKRFVLAAVVSTVFSFIFLNEPFVRGWRLRVVTNIANNNAPMPNLSVRSFVKMYLRGLVLIVSRFIYFLPFLIATFLSSQKLFGLLWKVGAFIWEFFVEKTYEGTFSQFIGFILPQFGLELIGPMLASAFYLIFVWPIYRVTMIKYALGEIGFGGFFSLKVIRHSIGVFRRNMSDVFGVYSFVLIIDTMIGVFGIFFQVITLGFGRFLLPPFMLGTRHWIKGYAYGRLAQILRKKNEI